MKNKVPVINVHKSNKKLKGINIKLKKIRVNNVPKLQHKGLKPANKSNLQGRMEAIIGQMQAIEGLSLNKLKDLRQKNSQIQILQQHVAELRSENYKIMNELSVFDFNVDEQKSIIESFQRNL